MNYNNQDIPMPDHLTLSKKIEMVKNTETVTDNLPSGKTIHTNALDSEKKSIVS